MVNVALGPVLVTGNVFDVERIRRLVELMKEHDLKNINSLNHYIGMKAIEPDAIPELRYMPWIVAALAGLLGFSIFLTGIEQVACKPVTPSISARQRRQDPYGDRCAEAHRLGMEIPALVAA